MEDFNKIIVLGTVTADSLGLSLEKTKAGISVCDFGLQVDSTKGERVEILNILIKTFGAQAEACSKALKMDSRVMIEGRLKIEEKNETTYMCIIASSITFLDLKN